MVNCDQTWWRMADGEVWWSGKVSGCGLTHITGRLWYKRGPQGFHSTAICNFSLVKTNWSTEPQQLAYPCRTLHKFRPLNAPLIRTVPSEPTAAMLELHSLIPSLHTTVRCLTLHAALPLTTQCCAHLRFQGKFESRCLSFDYQSSLYNKIAVKHT